ncbi:Holliday junction ATP-dependent DNA helicase RuvA [Spiroplasma culicicola]|uniref:Holliday junction DNA helicase RuvA n=1 Tax=Spiroplasma culicicola AES-1 TaxID=1276246 RepID=W6A7B5_9MOLU|nr:hypothetical protein [Spiroplasma culicicola]AHI52871.1 Holliday junction DNA helicase RuvA [Spiroplasma culicicola AES-1]
MFYLKAKIIKIYQNEIILEVNNTGYHGYLIEVSSIQLNQEVLIYFINLKTDYSDQYLFFTDKENYLMAKLLLEIKNVGIKTILSIFKTLTANELIAYAKNSDLNAILLATNVGQNICQKIIIKIRSKYLSQKYNKIQLNVIQSLHKLGYKIGDIYQAILKVDPNLDQDNLLKNTIIKLNEVYY